MSYIKKCSILAVLGAMLVFAMPNVSLAAGSNPVLSASSQGGGNVQVSISNAPAYSAVTMYERQGTTLWTTITNFGQTDNNGYFTSVVGMGNSGSGSAMDMYAVVGGYTSNTVSVYPGSSTGCSYGGCIGGLTLNPSNLNLAVGQSSIVSLSSGVNMSAYPPYISGNSNPNVASASVNNYQMTVAGNSSGSTTFTVCLSGGSTCASLYVTVNGGSVSGNVWFSPSNPSLYMGQSLAVSINSSVGYSSGPYTTSNYYYISSNSNSNAVSASISGTVLNLYGNQMGNSTITVCHSYLGFCGSLNVIVGGSTSGSSTVQVGDNYFSPRDITVTAGTTITWTNIGSMSHTITADDNSWNSGNLAPNQSYSRTFNTSGTFAYHCTYHGGVGGVGMSGTVTVTGGSGSGTITLSPSNLNISSGQTASVSLTLSAPVSGNFYVSSYPNSSIATVTLNNNSTITVYGVNSGTTSAVICYTGTNSCATLTVAVNGYYGSGTISASPSYVNMNIGQSRQVTLYSSNNNNYYNGYTIGYNSNSSVVSASVSGSNLNLYGLATGSSSVQVCQMYSSNCTTVSVNVSGSVLGTSTYPNGTLISENGTIYIVYKNTKTGFANWNAFSGLGFSMSNVQYVSNSGLSNSGYIIQTPYAAHPWGSWIKSGNTVYFVHETGLIPVADYGTFLNNGGQDSRVVAANSWDFNRPMLSVMGYNDYRLQ